MRQYKDLDNSTSTLLPGIKSATLGVVIGFQVIYNSMSRHMALCSQIDLGEPTN